MKKAITLFLLLIVYATLSAQQISDLQTRFTGHNVEVNYTLSTEKPVDIELLFSTDNGHTYQACRALNGNWQSQTSGNKNMTWECAEDGIFVADVILKIGIKKQAEIEMVFVKGSSNFKMGCVVEQGDACNPDETPYFYVNLSDFSIGKYEVTQAQWMEIMNDNPSVFKGDNLPVENVSWEDVQEFIRKLNVKTGKNYRLPTEAEWEYAAEGGILRKGYKYSGSNQVDAVAWYSGNSDGKTHPVGSKQPNELGIHDMSGNVWEWCSDWYGSYSNTGKTNPAGPSTGTGRVSRGGGWYLNEEHCRSTRRNSDLPQNKYGNLGFRLVLP